MEYCVIKNTTKVIDGSENPLEIMLKNAQNAGFTESEVEILTEEEYQVRVDLEPLPIVEPTDMEILQKENLLLKAQVQANSDVSDFHEELIVELAMIVYQ